MAEVNVGSSGQDEGLSHLQTFVALLTETRHSLAERQASFDLHADAPGQQAASSTARLNAFQETVAGLAESFATTSQATASELARLAATATELADHVHGAGADALRASEARFTAAIETTRDSLEQGATQLGEGFAEIEQAIDRGDENAAAVVAEHEEGFLELGTTVAEADSSYSQGDFELQGALDTTAGYLGEALEQYIATVFSGFYDQLQNELPPYITDLLQELGRTLHRSLDDYDGLVESVSGEMTSENESQMKQCESALIEGLHHREDDRGHTLAEMRTLLEEGERCRSSAGRGSEICTAYPPLVPMLAMAKEVADRVQEMMDVFNPFGG